VKLPVWVLVILAAVVVILLGLAAFVLVYLRLGFLPILAVWCVGGFAAVALLHWLHGDREWFEITALTRRGAIEQREMLEDMKAAATPRPCWRCGLLAPGDAPECPSCGAALV